MRYFNRGQKKSLAISALAGLFLSACVSSLQTPSTTASATQADISTLRASAWQRVAWSEIAAWQRIKPAEVANAVRVQCSRSTSSPALPLKVLCQYTNQLDQWPRSTWEQHFSLYRVGRVEAQGLLTAYFEPVLAGGLQRSAAYPVPIYGIPPDLLTISLSDLDPALKNRRLRGRLQRNRVIPYYSRAEIEAGRLPAETPVVAWTDDPIAVFFMQIQGSGRIQLAEGGTLALGYADQNGHPYRAIGKTLITWGAAKAEQISMQYLIDWMQNHPEKTAALMQSNPSYVFFRTLPEGHAAGPVGTLGVPLTAGYSLAVDPKVIPLGSLVLLESSWPAPAEDKKSIAPLNRLVAAQDTGDAIRGTVRADLFIGSGPKAAAIAGKMRQPLRYWVLWPNGQPLPD